MAEAATITSKVLIHEVDPEHMQRLKGFCQTSNLVGLKAEQYSNIMETLDSNIDLGAIFLCEASNREGKSGLDIAEAIHKVRPELPIFLRRENSCDLSDLTRAQQVACAGAYTSEETASLTEMVNKYIFNTYYPSAMIHGIEEFSENSLAAIFQNVEINVESPYLVRDRIIYGELFSIIPLEGAWCRGYMMLQSDEKCLVDLIKAKKTPLDPDELDFRSVNGLMGEITNMMWGGFKARFFQSSTPSDNVNFRIQVPTIINHSRNYISFGSEDPQLCFHYTIIDKDGVLEPISIYQKFIFHLSWSPDEFQEPPDAVENLVNAGELEFF